MKKYPIKFYKNFKIRNLYHLDLYRLEGAVESQLRDLGVEEIWEEPRNITVIEWADKATGFFPKKTTWIKFEYLDQDKRKITLNK